VCPGARPERRAVSWRCPVCRRPLDLVGGARRWCCTEGHSFDVAREGYVNLLLAGQRRSRRPGDDAEMVAARRRFLATGAYDPLSERLAGLVAAGPAQVVVDLGCGEGRHTRRLQAPTVLGVDVAKAAVAVAARADRRGRYAVASVADLPLDDAVADVAVIVFGPVVPEETARVLRPGGRVVAAYPGPGHLAELRRLVYEQAHPHEVKPPLRHAPHRFVEAARTRLRFPVVLEDPALLADLFTMTPYRWHAPHDIAERLEAALAPRFVTHAEVELSVYRLRA